MSRLSKVFEVARGEPVGIADIYLDTTEGNLITTNTVGEVVLISTPTPWYLSTSVLKSDLVQIGEMLCLA